MSIFLITEHQCVPVRPYHPDHGFHTLLLLLVLLLVSTFEPRESASSKLHLARNSIFQSILLLPSTECHGRKSSSTSRPHASMNKDSEVVLFMPAAAAIRLLKFSLSVGAILAGTPSTFLLASCLHAATS